MEGRLDKLSMEREGLLEGITALEAYSEEVYKGTTEPPGLRMCVDKLKDKLKLVDGEIEWLKFSMGKKDA